MKKTYDPRRGPRPGDYGYVMDPTAPVNGLAKVITKPYSHDPEELFLVEFVESHPLLHSGANLCRNNHGWWIHPDGITPVDMTAEIMQCRGHTYCRVGNRMGHAKCDAQDEFDPLTGAIIALARAYKTDPTKAAYKVLQVMSAVPAPEKPTSLKIVDRGGRSFGGPAPKKKRLYLESGTGKHCGVLGAPTDLVDLFSAPLCVGDVVKVIKQHGEAGEEPVVGSSLSIDHSFVMGCGDTDFSKPGVSDGLAIRKVKNYTDLKLGDTLSDGWITVREEEV